MHHHIRKYADQDLPLITTLFTETVRWVNSRDYSTEQIEAWAPQETEPARWRERLAGLLIIIAEVNGQLAGFCGYDGMGQIDFLYVDHRFQRRGVATALYRHVETEMRALKIGRLFTEASITARPFFERMGFAVIRKQSVQIRGITLRNYAMEKRLVP
jgi:putative acetyltransferase